MHLSYILHAKYLLRLAANAVEIRGVPEKMTEFQIEITLKILGLKISLIFFGNL